MSNNFIPDKNSQYGDGIMLNFYDGRISLARAKEGKDGNVYLEWCFGQDADRQPRKKSFPLAVQLGTPQEAIAKLKTFVQMIQEETGRPEREDDYSGQGQPSYPDNEPPF